MRSEISRGADRATGPRAVACLALAVCASNTVPVGAPAEPWLESGRKAVDRARALPAPAGRARNAILFIGDGMGVSTVTAARILAGQLRGQSGEEGSLSFERLPYVALAKTYNTNQQVPDSAGTMTAIVTGVKTRAGVLSVDEAVPRGDAKAVEGHRLETLLERAERRGLATGVVTTTTLTHATPAACYAHSPERDWESDATLSAEARAHGFPDIARQLVEFSHGDGLEVALGGGRAHFLPSSAVDPEYPEKKGARGDGRDLTAEWTARAADARYVWNRAQLEAIDAASTQHLLGLFEPSHMRFDADRERDPAGEPSLEEMTRKALDVLERDSKGYVLVVEGGRIDHGHHANSAYLALHDTLAFDRAVAAALERVDLAETLVVVTADHSHVFTISGYPTRGNDILGKVKGNDVRGEPSGELMPDALSLPFTTLGYQNGPGYTGASEQQPEGPKRLPHRPMRYAGIETGRPDLSAVDTSDPRYLQEAAFPLSSETHSGEDVAIYAGGPGAALFHGVQEQNYVYHAIVASLGWDEEPSALERLRLWTGGWTGWR